MSKTKNYREFYEEKVKREQNEKYLIKTKNYRKERNAYLEYQKQLGTLICKTADVRRL